jgi:hypothetical protein
MDIHSLYVHVPLQSQVSEDGESADRVATMDACSKAKEMWLYAKMTRSIPPQRWDGMGFNQLILVYLRSKIHMASIWISAMMSKAL